MIVYKCAFCQKTYDRKSWYDKHVCNKKKRFEELHNMSSIRAFRLYSHWRKRLGYLRKHKTISQKEFISSSFYETFVKLANYTVENWVISSFRYLDFIIDHRIAESKWMSEDTLHSYREHYNKNEDAMAQTKQTITNIRTWCNKNSTDLQHFFSVVTAGQYAMMILDNKISPWVLYGYDKAEVLLNNLNEDRRCFIEEFLNADYWKNRVVHADELHRSIQIECGQLFNDRHT